MSSLRATLLSTAQKWIDVHLAVDMEGVAALRTADCKYSETPKSLNLPIRNNEEWDKWHPETFKIFSRYDMKVNDSLVDEERRKVIMFVTANALSTGGVDYENDYVFILTMTEDGKLIKDHWAFIDSLTMMDFVKKVGFSMPDGQ